MACDVDNEHDSVITVSIVMNTNSMVIAMRTFIMTLPGITQITLLTGYGGCV